MYRQPTNMRQQSGGGNMHSDAGAPQSSTVDTNIFLEPLARPSVLGLYSLGAALFVVAAYWAGWFGTATTPQVLFPIVAVFGGIVQLIAASVAYRARNVFSTALFGTWGALFLSYGVLWGFVAAGAIPVPSSTFVAFGIWLVPISLITWSLFIASSMVGFSLFTFLGLLAGGVTILTVGQWTGGTLVQSIAGYWLVVASVVAWYTATALMVEEMVGREVLPLLRTHHEPSYVPGYGEPGVVRG